MIDLKSYFYQTDQGPFLNINEDLVDVDLVNKLYMILDGFGGTNVGDKTSMDIKNIVRDLYTKGASDPDSTLPFFFSEKYLIEGNILIDSIHRAHEEIKARNHTKDMSERGGSSGIFIAQSESILTLVSIGNCKGYLYRDGYFSQVVDGEFFSNLSSSLDKKYSNTIPTNGLGLFNDLHLSVKELKLCENDLLVFLTDGAYSCLLDDEIKHFVSLSDKKDSEKIKKIFDYSNEKGNVDNQSVLFLRF